MKRLVFKVGPRRRHAPGHAQARRGRTSPTCSPASSARRCGARPGSPSGPPVRGHPLAALRRPVGRRARPGTTGACASPPTTPSTARPSTRRESLGFSQDHREHHPHELRVLLAAAGPSLRSGQGPAAPRRGGVSRRASTPGTSGATPPPPARPRPVAQLPPGRRASGRRLRPLERAAFLKAYQEKKLKNLVYGLSGIFGNAATRIEAFAASGGVYAYGGYPDIDGLFREQAGELDPKKREALLHRIQQLMHDKVMYLPIWQLSLLQRLRPARGGVRVSGSSPTIRGRRPTRT